MLHHEVFLRFAKEPGRVPEPMRVGPVDVLPWRRFFEDLAQWL